jgi:hypothetical protein
MTRRHPDPDLDYTADWPATLRDMAGEWHWARLIGSGIPHSERLDSDTLRAVADMIQKGEPRWPTSS